MTKEQREFFRRKANFIARYNNPAIGSYRYEILRRLEENIYCALTEAFIKGKNKK